MNIFRIIGAVGIVLIIIGVLIKRQDIEDVLFIGGGLCLGAYSMYIEDNFFIILQAVFILAAVYDLIKIYIREET